MRRHHRLAPYVVLAVALSATAVAAQTPAGLRRLVPRVLRDGGVPGVSVALVRDGRVVWDSAFGVKNAATCEPVGSGTVFEAASLSKPVFAYAVLKLVDAGRIALDTPLVRYLPGTYDVGPDPRLDQITARRVLSHTTGFPNWRRDSLRIYFTPGARFSYSGEGYVYLSKVVEQVTGERLNDFMQRTVFDPLGMTSSSYVWQPRYDTTKTFLHNTRGEPAFRKGSPNANVAASLHTTARDYARFVAAILNGVGLRPETRRLMLTPQVQVRAGGAGTIDRPDAPVVPDVAWGLGWGLQTTPEGRSFFHWGDNGDAKAFVVARPRERSAVVMFANSTYGLSIAPEIVAAAVGGAQPGLAWLHYESYRSTSRELYRSLLARGAPALQDYLAWRVGKPDSVLVDEGHMNRIGLDLLRGGHVPDAIVVLEQNVADHPQSFNVYDSLGEALAAAGERDAAIRNYERSIELNPQNKGGLDALRKLRGDAQPQDSLDVTAVGRDPRWKVPAGRTTSVVDVKGKRALAVGAAPGYDVIWLDGYDFTNGVIELDVLGRSQPVQGSFLGVAFRVVDGQTHDAVYFRPFNFRATDSTRHAHAVQYVSHPRFPWQPLRTEQPGKYEKPIVPEPDGDEWFHVRVVVARPKVSVYVNDQPAPSLVVDELSDRTGGSVGLWIGEGSPGTFANLRVTRAR
jgi:CubicO group peptidase (beta-lactamase class C family)